LFGSLLNAHGTRAPSVRSFPGVGGDRKAIAANRQASASQIVGTGSAARIERHYYALRMLAARGSVLSPDFSTRRSKVATPTEFLKKTTIIAAPVLIGMLIGYPSGQAANDNNDVQDEKLMIQRGHAEAANLGIKLTITNQDPDLVGLGSYLVNITSACNACHSPAFITTSFTTTGNPYLLPPVFSGKKQADPQYYLGGNQNFGPPVPGAASIVSRNLTPNKSGMPEGHTLADFMQIMKTGIDLDHAHPNCAPGTLNTGCVPFPINGAALQVMPWAYFQSMTDRQLTAIYTYLSTIPCLEGGPGEPVPPATRCK
jgi:hypothetical protein